MQFCAAVRYFATGAFYSAIGDTQGVHKSSVCRAVIDVSDFLYANSEEFIRFPYREEFPLYAQDFAAMYGFPCIVGCVDGTHVAIQAPYTEADKPYVNRKGYHSINVQVSCNIKVSQKAVVTQVSQIHGNIKTQKGLMICVRKCSEAPANISVCLKYLIQAMSVQEIKNSNEKNK